MKEMDFLYLNSNCLVYGSPTLLQILLYVRLEVI